MSRAKILVTEFIERRYWPTTGILLNPAWKRTTEQYILPRIAAAFGGYTLTDVTSEAGERWWACMQSVCRSPVTANKHLVRLKHIFAKAVQWGYIRQSPVAFLRKAAEPRGRTNRFAPEKWEELVRKASPVLRLYMLSAHYTAGRRASLVALQRQDVDLARKMITFRHAKNGHPYSVPLVPEYEKILLSLPLPLDLNAHVLPRVHPASISQAFRRLCQRCGLADSRFHDIRHDVLSRIADKGGSQALLMEIAGHDDPRSTVRYTHLSPGMVRDAMAQAL